MKKLLVIKVGTNVLTSDTGHIDTDYIVDIAAQIVRLETQYDVQVILVSSGAVGCGRTMVDIVSNSRVAKRQVLASIGQVKLMTLYQEAFGRVQRISSQVLATKEDFRDRRHFLNMRHCFENLLHFQIVPIVNENDVISLDELMFTDNDELAGLIASMMQADELWILTNVDGLYSDHPKNPEAKKIDIVDIHDKINQCISDQKSDFGRGGMMTKAHMSQKVAKLGIRTRLLPGRSPSILEQAWQDTGLGTTFLPDKKRSSSIKQWIAHSDQAVQGEIVLHHKAVEMILNPDVTISILPVGVLEVRGNFCKGDLVRILNQEKQEIGLGKSQYDSDKLLQVLGMTGQKVVIHYDYLYLHNL